MTTDAETSTPDTSPLTSPPERHTYAPVQLVIHWIIVFLVAMQFLMNKSMSEAFEASVEAGRLVVSGGTITHAMGGAMILGVMLWRLYVRRTHGVPPAPKSLPPGLQLASRVVHINWYVLLIAQPVLGILALLTVWGWVGTLHKIGAWLIVLNFVLHFGAALYHAVRRDGTISRMAHADPASEGS